ncbi:MAG: hypothetical protein N3G21_04550 [Candidatus Hydrogenedentes bacterium]|nr:hypothetical protein [Candidatus Hydrogenedentota bacterium]
MKKKKTRFRFLGKLIDEKTEISVVVDRGVVVDLVKKDKPNRSGEEETIVFAPLMLDAQVNGGFGVSIQDENLDEERLVYLSRKFFSLGVAKWIPTVVTAPSEKIRVICEKISSAIISNSEVSKHIPGIHLEGPWISPVDGPRGAHPKEYVKRPSLEDWHKYKKASRGKIIYVTLAPEVDKNLTFSKHLLSEGVILSIGHHQAGIDILEKAIEWGINMFTHIGNGIANLIHRHENPIWFALGNDKVSFSLIADGFHLPKYLMKTIAKAKREENVFLVSDSTQFLGMKPGIYKEFENEVELLPSGKLCLKGTPYLAGSASSLLDCFNVWYNISEWSLRSCAKSCSIVPTKLLGVKFVPYRLRLGYFANFVVLNKRLKNGVPTFTPMAVFYEGGCNVLEDAT